MLKAYMVHDGHPHENAVLVFAKTAQEARKLGNGWNDVGCEGFSTVAANRLPEFDSLAQQGRESYVENKDEVLRQAYWRCEGDETCDHCDLAEMDGKYPVCEECGSCTDCGHMDDCPNKEG